MKTNIVIVNYSAVRVRVQAYYYVDYTIFCYFSVFSALIKQQ